MLEKQAAKGPFFKCNCIVCSQWKSLFIKKLSRKCLTMQTLISDPTPLLFQQNTVLIGHQSAGKTSQIPARWNYFPIWCIKQESLAGNGGGGGGGGPEGEDRNTAEETNCRRLGVVHYLCPGELQKEFALELVLVCSLVRGVTHAKTAPWVLYHCDCCFARRSCTACTLAAAPRHKSYRRLQEYCLHKHKLAR